MAWGNKPPTVCALPPPLHKCLHVTGPEHRVAAQQEESGQAEAPHQDQGDMPGEVEPRKHGTQPGHSLKPWRHLLRMSARWAWRQAGLVAAVAAAPHIMHACIEASATLVLHMTGWSQAVSSLCKELCQWHPSWLVVLCLGADTARRSTGQSWG